MYYDDIFHPTAENQYLDNNSIFSDNEHKRMLEQSKKLDKGYNKVTRKVKKINGGVKNMSIEVFTSGGSGSYIRDAETGTFYEDKVGTANEDLYFKVKLSTGECKSKNGLNALFYVSPQSYISHLGEDVPQNIINNWEKKRDNRLKVLKRYVENTSEVVVH